LVTWLSPDMTNMIENKILAMRSIASMY
jgi:hypothetical protein